MRRSTRVLLCHRGNFVAVTPTISGTTVPYIFGDRSGTLTVFGDDEEDSFHVFDDLIGPFLARITSFDSVILIFRFGNTCTHSSYRIELTPSITVRLSGNTETIDPGVPPPPYEDQPLIDRRPETGCNFCYSLILFIFILLFFSLLLCIAFC